MIAVALLAGWPGLSRTAERDLGDREEAALRAAVRRVAPSVVRIQTIGGLESVDGALLGNGPSTGLVVRPDGYIVSSAFNFVSHPNAILVTLGKRANIPARLVATDASRAIVLLKIDLLPADGELVVPEAAPPGSALPGAWAIAVGRTFDEQEPNVSVGIISALHRIWGKVVQTDAKISPANYGGPLVDLRGRVIGVLVPMSPMASGDLAGAEWYDSGIGFAVPLTDIQRVLPKLIEGHDLKPGLMGVSLKGRDLFAAPPVVAACQVGSPAYQAGLRAGDQIVAVNGHDVINQAQVRQQIGPLYAGDTVRVAVLRDKQRIEASFELTDALAPYEHPFLGILPMRDSPHDQPGNGKPGVTVRYVYPGSPAEKAGLRPADRLVEIDGHEIKTADAARELFDALAPEQTVRLSVLRGADRLELTAALARLPTDIPGPLPPARHADAAAANGPAAAGAVIDIQVPEFKNKCVAYVPAHRDQAATYGVLIWLPPPGKLDRQQLLAQWQTLCDENDLILLAPQPRDATRWEPDEVEFIGRALHRLRGEYPIDPARIVAHGYQGGGAMALLFSLAQPGTVAGVAAVDAALPASARPQPVEPTARLAILLAHATHGPLAAALGPQLERLRELKYPVTELKLDRPGRYLDKAEQATLLRWIDGLDRL